MEFSNMFLKFTLKPTQPAQESPTKFEVAYDIEKDILHIYDALNHTGASLINTINSNFINDLLSSLRIETKNTRCFIYQSGLSFEYSEINNAHPFHEFDIKLAYKPFMKMNKVKV